MDLGLAGDIAHDGELRSTTGSLAMFESVEQARWSSAARLVGPPGLRLEDHRSERPWQGCCPEPWLRRVGDVRDLGADWSFRRHTGRLTTAEDGEGFVYIACLYVYDTLVSLGEFMVDVAERLTGLGPVFRWSDARDAGLSDPVLYALVEDGQIERISHGLYRRTDAEIVDLDLVIVAATQSRATVCLTSALARHDLTDQIPARIDVALPRGTRRPELDAPVRWHHFAPATFDLGREVVEVDAGFTIGLYSAERSIVDAYRLRHLEGDELGREALKAWLRLRGSQPSQLLGLAASFPKALGRLREDLRVLLGPTRPTTSAAAATSSCSRSRVSEAGTRRSF